MLNKQALVRALLGLGLAAMKQSRTGDAKARLQICACAGIVPVMQ